MNVHIVVETWGEDPDDIGVTVFTDRYKAEERWKALIRNYWDGSDRDDADITAEIEQAANRRFVYQHGNGFIAIFTEAVV